jgi:hypothetical protein
MSLCCKPSKDWIKKATRNIVTRRDTPLRMIAPLKPYNINVHNC